MLLFHKRVKKLRKKFYRERRLYKLTNRKNLIFYQEDLEFDEIEKELLNLKRIMKLEQLYKNIKNDKKLLFSTNIFK